MPKTIMYMFIGVMGTIGSFVPTLWGASMLDPVSILGSVVGGFVGIYAYWKLRKAGYLE